MTEKLLSIPEFCERLGGISPATVYTWLSLRKFGLERTKIGSRVMLAESELDKVVNAGRKSPARKQKVELDKGSEREQGGR